MPISPRSPAERPRARGLALAVALATATALTACSEPPSTGGPSAERGRQVYLAQCIACHNPDPARPGSVGPPVRGASRELLEAKVVKGTYPPGYAPKRPTAIMAPQPALEPEIANLAEFLK
jgi:mono/diheme cytochrome c family protein